MSKEIKKGNSYGLELSRFFADNQDGVFLVFNQTKHLKLLLENTNLEFILPDDYYYEYDVMRGIKKGDRMKVTTLCYQGKGVEREYRLTSEEYLAAGRPQKITIEEKLVVKSED